MSRLWDTSQIYVRAEVDELLQDYPNRDVGALAETFEHSHPTYEGDPDFAREIVIELRKRADADVRFWPTPPDLAEIEREVRAIITATASSLSVGEPRVELEVADAPGYWWQRM